MKQPICGVCANANTNEGKKASSSSTGAIQCATTGCSTKGRMDRFFRTARTGGGATAVHRRHPLDIWIIYGGGGTAKIWHSALVYEPPGSIYAHCYRVLAGR